MNDERISELLARHPGPANVDADFEDRLLSILQREMRRPQSPRLVLLVAAALTIVALLGAAAVGSGLVRLPSLDLSLVPQPTTETETPTEAPTAAQVGEMLGSHFGHTASLLADGRVLIAGGLVDLGAEVYDPDLGTWSATAPMVAMREGHTATILADGTVLVVGGAATDMRPAHTSAEIYDPRADTWTATGSMASPRTHHTANLLPDGRVLVAGGGDQPTGVGYASTEIYDPATGQWSAAGDMNVRRVHHTATLLQSGLLLVAGGTVEASTSAELYDPVRGSWTPTGSMIVNREGHSAVLLPDGRVFVIGGFGIIDSRTTTTISRGELFDPATGSWAAFFHTLDGAYAAVALLPDGKVLASQAASVDIWDPATSRWTAAPPLNSPSNWVLYSATLLHDATVLMAGGWETSDAGVGPPSLFERYAALAPVEAGDEHHRPPSCRLDETQP